MVCGVPVAPRKRHELSELVEAGWNTGVHRACMGVGRGAAVPEAQEVAPLPLVAVCLASRADIAKPPLHTSAVPGLRPHHNERQVQAIQVEQLLRLPAAHIVAAVPCGLDSRYANQHLVGYRPLLGEVSRARSRRVLGRCVQSSG